MYDSLTVFNSKGRLVNDLATKWKASKDLKTYWFWIRHDVKYANGRPFTSSDVVANVLHNLDLSVPSQWRPPIADIRSTRSIGKYEVRFKLGHPSIDLPAALAQIEMSDLTNKAQLDTVGNGTGPYKVKNFVPGQTLTLVPNPLFFGQKACLAQIVFVREPDPTSMVTDFTSGKLGLIWQAPLTALATLRNYKNGYLVTPKLVTSEHLWDLDESSPPFNNVLARQALSYAIDRATMVKAAFFGTADPALTNNLIATTNPVFDKALKPYPFDLNKAKQLFLQAGVKPGTTFTFWALAGRRDEWITMAQILQQDLEKIGYHLSIQRSDVSTWLAKFFPAGKSYPNTIIGNYFSMPPNPTFAMKQGQFGSCECNWKNNSFEALAAKAPGIKDEAARQVVYDKMQQIFSAYAPALVIAHQTNIVAVQKRITNAWEDAQGNV